VPLRFDVEVPLGKPGGEVPIVLEKLVDRVHGAAA
jgi:hypothetical protein